MTFYEEGHEFISPIPGLEYGKDYKQVDTEASECSIYAVYNKKALNALAKDTTVGLDIMSVDCADIVEYAMDNWAEESSDPDEYENYVDYMYQNWEDLKARLEKSPGAHWDKPASDFSMRRANFYALLWQNECTSPESFEDDNSGKVLYVINRSGYTDIHIYDASGDDILSDDEDYLELYKYWLKD